VEPFIPGLLPPALRPWVMDIAERMQCPPDFTGAAAIVALGSAIGRRCGIRPKRHDDWTVVPNLWGAVIGRPGVLKSPAVEETLRPLRRLEAEAGEAHRTVKKGATREEITGKLASLEDGTEEPARAPLS
jgi:putative DNA primase/helicase